MASSFFSDDATQADRRNGSAPGNTVIFLAERRLQAVWKGSVSPALKVMDGQGMAGELAEKLTGKN